MLAFNNPGEEFDLYSRQKALSKLKAQGILQKLRYNSLRKQQNGAARRTGIHTTTLMLPECLVPPSANCLGLKQTHTVQTLDWREANHIFKYRRITS